MKTMRSKDKKRNEKSFNTSNRTRNLKRHIKNTEDRIAKIRKVIIPKKTYTSVKYKGSIYSIGDDIVFTRNNGLHYIGKLLRIISENGIKNCPYWPSAELELYYMKINKENKDILNDNKSLGLSDYQAFKSMQKIIIFIEHFIDKCKVVSLEEYQKSDNSQNTYFYRATYDPTNELNTPQLYEDTKSFVCQNPLT